MAHPHHKRRRPFEVPNLNIEVTSEVSVGAYARRQVLNRWALGGLGLGLTLIAALVLWVMDPFSSHITFRSTVRCVACNFEGAIDVPSNEQPPHDCPKCGEQACRELWRCRACSERFMRSTTTSVTRCPRCSSDNVGAATSAEPSATPPSSRPTTAPG